MSERIDIENACHTSPDRKSIFCVLMPIHLFRFPQRRQTSSSSVELIPTNSNPCPPNFFFRFFFYRSAPRFPCTCMRATTYSPKNPATPPCLDSAREFYLFIRSFSFRHKIKIGWHAKTNGFFPRAPTRIRIFAYDFRDFPPKFSPSKPGLVGQP